MSLAYGLTKLRSEIHGFDLFNACSLAHVDASRRHGAYCARTDGGGSHVSGDAVGHNRRGHRGAFNGRAWATGSC